MAAPSGKPATWKVERAGRISAVNSREYTSFIWRELREVLHEDSRLDDARHGSAGSLDEKSNSVDAAFDLFDKVLVRLFCLRIQTQLAGNEEQVASPDGRRVGGAGSRRDSGGMYRFVSHYLILTFA